MNDASAPDVLVVDDSITAAEDYAQMIESKTGLQVVFTDDTDFAIELCRKYAVKVLVLDQRMPVRSGTAVYAEVSKTDLNVRAIMLTGHASPEEVGAAMDLGFKAYLDKQQIQKLPDKVLHEYIAYQVAATSTALTGAGQRVIFTKRTSRFSRLPDVTYRLLRTQLLEDKYKFDEDWADVVTVHAGETKTSEISVDVSKTIVLERTTTTRLSQQFGLSNKSIAALNLQLGTELTSQFKTTTTSTLAVGTKVTRTFTLPQEPPDPEQLHIRFRRIQQAPEYSRIRVDVATECSCCGVPSVIVLEAFLPTGKVALRHEDHLSSGEVKTNELGSGLV